MAGGSECCLLLRDVHVCVRAEGLANTGTWLQNCKRCQEV